MLRNPSARLRSRSGPPASRRPPTQQRGAAGVRSGRRHTQLPVPALRLALVGTRRRVVPTPALLVRAGTTRVAPTPGHPPRARRTQAARTLAHRARVLRSPTLPAAPKRGGGMGVVIPVVETHSFCIPSRRPITLPTVTARQAGIATSAAPRPRPESPIGIGLPTVIGAVSGLTGVTAVEAATRMTGTAVVTAPECPIAIGAVIDLTGVTAVEAATRVTGTAVVTAPECPIAAMTAAGPLTALARPSTMTAVTGGPTPFIGTIRRGMTGLVPALPGGCSIAMPTRPIGEIPRDLSRSSGSSGGTRTPAGTTTAGTMYRA